jgi:predicted amidohydrolase YtcJ
VAALLLLAPIGARADTLIDNVNGQTIGADGGVETFTGLLIGNDGRISAVYRRGDKRPAKVDYKVDGHGRILVPGMVDAHLHVMDLGFSALTLDLSGTKSLGEAQAAIRAFAQAHPDRPWIVGGGWNQENWGLGRFPTAAELDAAVADRPVWLVRVDGHAGWANSTALKQAGIATGTKDPAGGRIERETSGKPSGVLIDGAKTLIESKLPPPRPVDRDLALQTAQRILFRKGVTAAADMGTTIEDWQTYRRAGDEGRLYIRIMAYARGNDAMVLIGGAGPTPWLYDDRLRLNGVKLFLDGALGSRGAWLKAPYADAPGQSGLPQIDPTAMRNLMSRAAMDNFQVAVHAIGDRANNEALAAIAELSETYKGDRRWRVEHAQVLDPADFGNFAQFGAVASMQPLHQTSDRLMAEARLGSSRLSGAYAWKSVSAAGGRLAFGSDAPVEAPDPFAGIAAAITREGPDGQPFSGWQPQEKLDRASALAAYTTGAAWAGFAEAKFGRIAPGLRADFLFVDVDPLLASPSDIRRTRVLETWIGGRKVYDAANDGEGQ